jgi:hypothetical protein
MAALLFLEGALRVMRLPAILSSQRIPDNALQNFCGDELLFATCSA